MRDSTVSSLHVHFISLNNISEKQGRRYEFRNKY